MVICLERGADLHTAQLMPLPLTVSCFNKIQIRFTFLVPAHPGSPGKRAVKRVCVCVSCMYTANARFHCAIVMNICSWLQLHCVPINTYTFYFLEYLSLNQPVFITFGAHTW